MESEYSQFIDKSNTLKGWEDHPAFQVMCKKYMENRLGDISDDQFDVVYNYAWDAGHSSGFHEVATIVDDLCDILEKFVIHPHLQKP